jgi:hypothetical protein
MHVITYRGRLVELTVLGDIVNDELVLECWDMSADGGRWFTLSRDADAGMILKDVQRPVPLDLLEQVAVIAGLELTEQ